MYYDFFNISEKDAHRLLQYLKSANYAEETKLLYKESGFWASLKKKTYVGVNNEAVMLYSGHNFVYCSPPRDTLNKIIQFMANFKFMIGFIGKIKTRFNVLHKRLEHFEKTNSVKYFLSSNYNNSGPQPSILDEAMHYNASKVYDTLENYFCILKFLEYRRKDRMIFFELGAGAGLTSLVISEAFPDSKVIICDLPESICIAYVLISYFTKGKKRLVLPNESDGIDNIFRHEKFDILFLTPNQVSKIPNECVDCCLNANSMQEMSLDVIKNYFSLIKRIGSCDSIFYCKNLIESKQYSETKFEHYPWHIMGKVLHEGIAQFASKQYRGGGDIKIKVVKIRE